MNNSEFYGNFNVESNCREYFKRFYNSKVKNCPKCKCQKLKWSPTLSGWRCCKCSKKISLKSISFMRDSNKGFRDWLEILHLVCHSKKSNSIKEIWRKSRQTRYETVYYMVQKIRMEMGKINSIDSRESFTRFLFVSNGEKIFKNLPVLLEMTFTKSASRREDKIRLITPKFVRTGCIKYKRTLKFEDNYPYVKLLKTREDEAFEEYILEMPHSNIMGNWKNHLRENIVKLLKGVYHLVSGLHLQKVLDEYSFKYNYRGSHICKMEIFLQRQK